MKNTISLLFLLPILFVSCTSEETIQKKQVAYYQFRDDDYDKLMSFELNEEIKYVNADGDEYIVEVNETSSDYKTRLEDCTFHGCYKSYFDYDLQKTHLGGRIQYAYYRAPINTEEAKDDKFTEYPSDFFGEIRFILWNEIYEYPPFVKIEIDFDIEKTSMNVNGITYDNVIIYESGNDEPIIMSNGFEKNVHRIYYDVKHGIIGFDDLNENEWRLSN